MEFYEKFPLSFELHARSAPDSIVIELDELADVCRFFLDVLESAFHNSFIVYLFLGFLSAFQSLTGSIVTSGYSHLTSSGVLFVI